jgi:sugar phosphate isomerase/epimerase
MNAVTRRDFLRLTAGAGLGAAGLRVSAIEPIKRTGPARLRLALSAYSFRAFFKTNKWAKASQAPPAVKQIDLFEFVDFCAEHGCEGTELTSYYFPPDVTDDYLVKLRGHVAKRGLEVSGTAVGNNFTLPAGPARDQQIADTKRWIDRAAVLGAPFVRVFAGSTRGLSPQDQRKNCINALEQCCDYAGTRKIFLGVENHGGIVAEPEALLSIVGAVKSPWCGINLDTGNFHTVDPYGDLAKCVPYAVNVQVKAEVRRKDAREDEPADLPRVVKILRDGGYQGFVALEYEAREDPWTAVPRLLRQMKRLF